MDDVMSIDDSSGGTQQRNGNFWYAFSDHFWWTVSRLLLLIIIVSGMLLLDIPTRLLMEGNLVQQIEREETRERLDERELINELLRAMSDMDVSLTNLQNRVSGGDFAKERDAFAHAAKRFNERFSARRKPFSKQEFEAILYEVGDISYSIRDRLNEGHRQGGDRQFVAQAARFKENTSSARHVAEDYLCERLRKYMPPPGECR